MQREVPIGALARETGVKVPTIRYYESVGLLPEPVRSSSNRRTYGDRDVHRLNFIRHARELGFEVDQIRELLTLADQPQRPCSEADAIAHQHLADIESKIERLTALRAEVQRMLASCAHGSIADCRVIEVLADHAHCRHMHGAIEKPVAVTKKPARTPRRARAAI
jgi:Cu(I)-responsive transcriptional regulator